MGSNPGRVHGAAGIWRPSLERPPTTYACTDEHRGPHNRCQHPTPAPVGHHRCGGDPGCPYLIANRYHAKGVTRCPWHTDDWSAERTRTYREFMGDTTELDLDEDWAA